MTLWWALPRFTSVEAWPGRGWLVETGDGAVQFVRDLDARLPAGVEPDRRFWDPPPCRRVTTRPARAANAAQPAIPVRPAPRRRAIRIEEPDRYRPVAPPVLVDDEQAPFQLQTERIQRITIARAAALLRSLLDPRQRHDWDASGTFWVQGAFGAVRLGVPHDLAHRRAPEDACERALCVVTTAYRRIPLPDEWTSMLLTLRHDPDRFFRVANVLRRERHGARRNERLAAYQQACRDGRVLDAAYLAHDVAGLGPHPVAAPLAVAAAVLVLRHADLDPPTAAEFGCKHRRLLARGRDAALAAGAPRLAEWIRTTPRFTAHRDLVAVAVADTDPAAPAEPRTNPRDLDRLAAALLADDA